CHKQVNLGERTWNDDLRAMSYSLGIAIVVLVAEQNVILQTSLFTAGMLRSQQPRRRAAEQPDEIAPPHGLLPRAEDHTFHVEVYRAIGKHCAARLRWSLMSESGRCC